MNEISFVVAPYEFGPGVADGLEPVIDGVSLVDVLKWADGEIWHAGLVDIEHALRELRDVPAPGAARVVQVLGCTCSDDQCSPVTATVSATDVAITWSGIHARRQTHADIGPFRFSPSDYAAAVGTPVRARQPVREPVDIDQLAAGMPQDHAAWLRAMTMAFGRDFFVPSDPDAKLEIAARGVRAFEQAGMPISDEAVREWARTIPFSDEAIERYVIWFRELS
jgi:hypothetical protein